MRIQKSQGPAEEEGGQREQPHREAATAPIKQGCVAVVGLPSGQGPVSKVANLACTIHTQTRKAQAEPSCVRAPKALSPRDPGRTDSRPVLIAQKQAMSGRLEQDFVARASDP